MKIYTRTGDTGETALFGGGRVPKNHLRVESFGEVDELNAVIGWAVVSLDRAAGEELIDRFRLIQEDLFSIGAHLATPAATEGGPATAHLPPLPAERIAAMEGWIDEAEQRLSPLQNFILPGGSETAARLHIARTVCRRAERRVMTLTAESPVDGTIIVYLNRLSDLLFTLARLANLEDGAGDVPWRERTDGKLVR